MCKVVYISITPNTMMYVVLCGALGLCLVPRSLMDVNVRDDTHECAVNILMLLMQRKMPNNINIKLRKAITKMALFNDLPNAVLAKILEHLDGFDLAAAECTCTQM